MKKNKMLKMSDPSLRTDDRNKNYYIHTYMLNVCQHYFFKGKAK